MSGFTPGPWFVGQTADSVPALVGDGDSVIALFPDPRDGYTRNAADEALIATALDLYSELRDLVEAIDAGDAVDSAWLDAARAALAKVEQP